MHLFQSLPFLEFVEDKSLWVNISQNTLWWCPILVVAKFERLSHHCFKSKSSIFGGLDITLQTSLKLIDIPKLKALDQTSFPNFVNLCSELLQIKKKMKLKMDLITKKLKAMDQTSPPNFVNVCSVPWLQRQRRPGKLELKSFRWSFLVLKIIRWNSLEMIIWTSFSSILRCDWFFKKSDKNMD